MPERRPERQHVQMLITLAQLLHVVGLAALATAAYAGYELVTGPDWRRRLPGTVARVWIFAALAVSAVEDLLFDANALLLGAYQLGAPLDAVQPIFLASLVVATVVWMRE